MSPAFALSSMTRLSPERPILYPLNIFPSLSPFASAMYLLAVQRRDCRLSVEKFITCSPLSVIILPSILLSLLQVQFKLITVFRSSGRNDVVHFFIPVPLIRDSLMTSLHRHNGARRKADNSCQVASPLVVLHREISSIVLKFLAMNLPAK